MWIGNASTFEQRSSCSRFLVLRHRRIVIPQANFLLIIIIITLLHTRSKSSAEIIMPRPFIWIQNSWDRKEAGWSIVRRRFDNFKAVRTINRFFWTSIHHPQPPALASTFASHLNPQVLDLVQITQFCNNINSTRPGLLALADAWEAGGENSKHSWRIGPLNVNFLRFLCVQFNYTCYFVTWL